MIAGSRAVGTSRTSGCSQTRSAPTLGRVQRQQPGSSVVVRANGNGARAAAAAAVASLIMANGALAAPKDPNLLPYEWPFAVHCAICHFGGGNVLASEKSLFPEDLERNKMTSPEAIYDIIYNGKNWMPGYGRQCSPKEGKGWCFPIRLSDQEMKGLRDLTLENSARRWKLF